MKWLIGGLSLVLVTLTLYGAYNVTETVDPAWIYGSLIGCGLFMFAMTFFMLGFFIVRGVFFSAIDAATQSQQAGQQQLNAVGKVVTGLGKLNRPFSPADYHQQLPAPTPNNLMPLPFKATNQNFIIDGLPGVEDGEFDSGNDEVNNYGVN